MNQTKTSRNNPNNLTINKLEGNSTKNKQTMKILKEISTHKAVKEDGVINIYIKGLDFEDLHFEDELIRTIPLENEDDLLPIFEGYEEQNRINRAEFQTEMA